MLLLPRHSHIAAIIIRAAMIFVILYLRHRQPFTPLIYFDYFHTHDGYATC